ncbi:MAG: TetR family transcriptional regulator C-terminal domain-containing protein [Alphaproteobacteria bacterium]|nr:TetR family transcriptional regulator C-terminal domain-containing protein [Alphaproteobacteria bacterium]
MSTLPETVRDLRRAQILREARAIVAEEGVQALTFGALEKRLPFTRGVVTYHFENKSEIVEAVLEEAIRDIHHGILDRVSREGTAAARIRAALRGVVSGYLENVEAGVVLMSFWSQLQSMPDLAARNARIHARYRTQAAALVREGVASGELRADADPEVVAALMVAITSGIATQAYAEPGAFDVEAAIDQAGEAIVRLVTAG